MAEANIRRKWAHYLPSKLHYRYRTINYLISHLKTRLRNVELALRHLPFVLICLFSINHNEQRHLQQFDHWDIIWLGGTMAGFIGLRGLCWHGHTAQKHSIFRFGHHPSQKIKVGGTWSLLSLHVCGRRLPSQLSRDRDVAENGQNMFTKLKDKEKLAYFTTTRIGSCGWGVWLKSYQGLDSTLIV